MKTFIIALVYVAIFPVALLAASTDTNSIAGGLYKTVVNESAGQFAVVDTNREIVTLYDKSDRVLWTTNIVAGLKTAPVMGERKIHGLLVYKDELWTNVGRGYGVVDIKTGDLKGFAQD